MAKNTYANRLKKLFSEIETAASTPVEDVAAQSVQPEGPSAEHAAVEQPAVDLSSASDQAPDRPVEGKPAEAPWPGENRSQGPGHKAAPRQATSNELEDMPVVFTQNGAGWGDFLDGIRRDEKIAYVYDQSVVQAVESDNAEIDLPSDDQAVGTSITIAGLEIGQLLLGNDPNRQWSAEDLDVVNAVAQQLAQQIETLRLLDEAERSRTDAEESFRRLAHQSGQDAPVDPVDSHLPRLQGWDENGLSQGLEVAVSQPLEASQTDGNPEKTVLKTPIRLEGGILGELEVVKPESELSMDEANLVETVAQRLSQQMENLRLLEESRHFRSESEDAIRRLTYQSWRAYLENSERDNLAFQYNRKQVLPLDKPAELKGREFPLKVREEVIGQLAVDSAAIDRDEVKNLVNVIGDRLSTHLDGLRLAEQREQALEESELLYSISARLSTAQSLEEALTSISLPAIESGVHDSRLFIANLDEHGHPESLSLSAIWYPDEGAQLIPVVTQFFLTEYPAYQLAMHDPESPVIITNVLADDRLDDSSREIFLRSGAESMVILPLAVTSRWVGVVFINWPKPREFSEQERRLYITLSRQAAVVVNNRLLLEQTRKRAQELQTVAQVSTAASTILDPRDLLQSVVDLTKSSFSLYHIQAFLHQPIENILEVAAASSGLDPVAAGEKSYITWNDNGPVARAARERQVVIVNDVRNEPGYKLSPHLPDLHAEMVIPMVVGNRLLGVFDVQSDQVNRFTRDDARTFSTLASQVAVALQNAELYAEQSATVERLRELDHLKSAFLANMSHELRTPLNSILGFAEVLLLELDGPLNDVMNNDVRLIEKNGKHLLSLINDVLDMAKIEAGRMNLAFERFVLHELLEETIDITSSLAREKSLYLHIDPSAEDQVEMSADRVRIRQVLINVISNAVKFTEKGGISLHARVIEDRLRLEVHDTGIGIPPDKLEMIFEAFSQVDTSTTRKVGGTGLGLPISRRLIEMHNGRLWAESNGINGEGSVFIIEMPREPVAPA